ncbi:MAG: aldehyde ferredoxin oxidoreductase family protein [Chloroflexi bacterium]|nr:aldehyde ferredoxin oxidoreductase family protein [Chloroflexota bacterium]
MPYGYNGKILHVNLSKRVWDTEEPGDAFYRQYGGGSALGLYHILREMPPHIDAFSPENMLTFSLSPLTGAPVSGQSRMMANAKSPLTDAIGDSQCGGYFPAEMKFAGYDAIIFRGRAPHPVYLYIRDGHVELRDASHLWGKTTHAVEQILKQELGDKEIEIAQCGPAGEKLVRFAAIINMASRANGRTGLGAVMGSKNLKAVVVRGAKGAKSIPWADPQAIIELTKLGPKIMPDNADMAGLAKYGTASVVMFQNTIGSLPTYNYDSGDFSGAEKISGEVLYDTLLRGAQQGRQNTTGRESCYSCSVRCKRVVETEWKGNKVEPHYGGPEYETLSTFGSYCGVSDLNAVSLASQLCNAYGADTISAGATIAFAMNCYEQEILSNADTGGIELRYGNADAMIQVLKDTLTRATPLGEMLAEGSARAAQKIGDGAPDLVVAAKKQEFPAHMPQAKRSLALIYAVNPFGADHQSSEHDPMYEEGNTSDLYMERLNQIGLYEPQPQRSLTVEKVRFALKTQQFYSGLDTFGLCQFVFGPAWTLYGPSHVVDLIRAATGWNYSLYEYMLAGERRLNMLRAFNAREGMDRTQDALPKKMYQALKGGATDGVKLSQAELEQAKDAYYAMSGWDVKSGIPTRAKLQELGIEWVADIIGV